MTLTELKTRITESPNAEWFNNKEVTLNYPHIDFKETLKGITAVYEFLNQQIEGFSSYKNLPPEMKTVKENYERGRTAIINIVKKDQVAEAEWDAYIRGQIDQKPKFLYNSPITMFLIKVFNELPSHYQGAYEYITKSQLVHISNKTVFAGYLLAYEFSSKGFSEITKRKKIEEKSLENTKKDFQSYLTESETHLSGYLSTAHKKLIDTSKEIDDLVEGKKKNYDEWFTKCIERTQKLEDLYQQKLKLEAPAKYWKDRAIALRNGGFWWLGGLIFCLVISIIILIWVLSQISNGNIEKIFSNTGTAIKWSVVLVTIISFLAFAIRTLSKLTFSSFHLYRDAQEREQLTYVYLALQKEKGVDQTERHLVMQSLFSRADSGLLKDDASPTMPGNIIDKFTK